MIKSKYRDPVAQLIKNPPALQEAPGRFLGQEDSLEKGVGYPLQCSWISVVAQMVQNLPAMRGFSPWVGKIPWRRAWQPTPVFLPRRIPMDRGAWRAQRVRHDWMTKHSTVDMIQQNTNADDRMKEKAVCPYGKKLSPVLLLLLLVSCCRVPLFVIPLTVAHQACLSSAYKPSSKKKSPHRETRGYPPPPEMLIISLLIF